MTYKNLDEIKKQIASLAHSNKKDAQAANDMITDYESGGLMGLLQTLPYYLEEAEFHRSSLTLQKLLVFEVENNPRGETNENG